MENVKGSRDTIRSVLNLKETFALQKLVQDLYVESGLDNKAFAAHANTVAPANTFRFPIKQNHVATMLTALDIVPNKARHKEDACGEALGVIARVQELEDQMRKLTTWLKTKGF